MNNNDLMKNKFYDYYSKKTTVTIPEAVALSLDYDPRVIFWRNNNYRLLQKDDGRGFSKSFVEEYCERVDILESDILNATQVQNTRLQYIHGNQVYLHIIPKWCKFKDFSFPEKLEVLIRKYHAPEFEVREGKCLKCYNELEQQKTKISDLEKKLSVPNPKRARSLHKAIIGMLSSKYGRDEILQSFKKNSAGVNHNSKSLITLKKIRDDLDLQGINLDDETIRGIINNSIFYLEEESK